MSSSLPLRFRIVHYASRKENFSVNDLIRDLADEYRGERQFCFSMLAQHCESLRASGLMEAQDVDLTPDGKPLVTYRITEYGMSRLSYLPDR